MTQPNVSVILPAYNEAAVIATVVERIRNTLNQTNYTFELLVIDDGSTDETATQAQAAGATVLQHPYNIGNGAAVKTGIRQANGEIILLLDADGQHPPEDIPGLLALVGRYDMVVGARTAASDSDWYRDIANKVYNRLASYVCGRPIDDLTSGFRAIKADIAKSFVPLLPNTFSYPTTITLSVVRSGYSLTYVPIVAARRVGKSKIKLLRDGSRFLMIILKVTTLFSPLKVFVPTSLLMFLLGFGYGLFRVVTLNSRYGPTSSLLMTISVLVFMIGLVSEQITQLLFERTYQVTVPPVEPASSTSPDA